MGLQSRRIPYMLPKKPILTIPVLAGQTLKGAIVITTANTIFISWENIKRFCEGGDFWQYWKMLDVLNPALIQHKLVLLMSHAPATRAQF